jgi:hypothetical protein
MAQSLSLRPHIIIISTDTNLRARPEVLFALLTRGLQGAVMLVAMLGIHHFLSQQEQGLFFVFVSLGVLLQLGEFGVAYATLQTATHLAAAGEISRLAQVQRQARRLNLLLMGAALAVVGSLGLFLFARRADISPSEVAWIAPWLAFVVAAFAAQIANLEVVLIEGSLSPTVAWRIRFFQEVLAGGAFIAALLGGAGLWSLAVLWATRAAVAGFLTGSARSLPTTGVVGDANMFNWKADAWPFQWKIGLSYLSGFLIFQAINPIVLVEKGTIVAGKVGISLAMMNMVLAISTVWPLSQASRYGRMITNEQFGQLRREFWLVTFGSTAFTVLLTLGVLSALQLLTVLQPFLARTADLIATAAFLATAVVHHIVLCIAVLLRAERREPLLAASIMGGLLNVVVIWMAARHGDLHAIALANLGCAAIGIPIAAAYYRRCTVRWQLRK